MKYVATIEIYIYANSDEEAVKVSGFVEKSLNNINDVEDAEVISLVERRHYGFNNRNLRIATIREKQIQQQFIKNFQDEY